MTIAVDLGRKAPKQTNKKQIFLAYFGGHDLVNLNTILTLLPINNNNSI